MVVLMQQEECSIANMRKVVWTTGLKSNSKFNVKHIARKVRPTAYLPIHENKIRIEKCCQ